MTSSSLVPSGTLWNRVSGLKGGLILKKHQLFSTNFREQRKGKLLHPLLQQD